MEKREKQLTKEMRLGILLGMRLLFPVLFLQVLFLTGCAMMEDPILDSFGEYTDSEYYITDGFQDYTIYAKYVYSSADLSGNLWLEKVRPEDFEVIQTHLDDFEGWIETIGSVEPDSKVAVNYDFDRSVIDTEDYFYIDSEEHTWETGQVSLVNYDIYYFDTQTQILYFFHNNI